MKKKKCIKIFSFIIMMFVLFIGVQIKSEAAVRYSYGDVSSTRKKIGTNYFWVSKSNKKYKLCCSKTKNAKGTAIFETTNNIENNLDGFKTGFEIATDKSKVYLIEKLNDASKSILYSVKLNGTGKKKHAELNGYHSFINIYQGVVYLSGGGAYCVSLKTNRVKKITSSWEDGEKWKLEYLGNRCVYSGSMMGDGYFGYTVAMLDCKKGKVTWITDTCTSFVIAGDELYYIEDYGNNGNYICYYSPYSKKKKGKIYLAGKDTEYWVSAVISPYFYYYTSFGDYGKDDYRINFYRFDGRNRKSTKLSAGQWARQINSGKRLYSAWKNR